MWVLLLNGKRLATKITMVEEGATQFRSLQAEMIKNC